MGERAVNVPVAAISPVQQMLASGTGALLTSVFGEITEAKPKNGLVSLKVRVRGLHQLRKFVIKDFF